jgi:hypothetical protein
MPDVQYIQSYSGALGMADVLGYRVLFSRRRYPRKTYTWAFVKDKKGDYHSLGDPYPGVRWRADILVEAVRRVVDQL